jgi:hypothetical protein
MIFVQRSLSFGCLALVAAAVTLSACSSDDSAQTPSTDVNADQVEIVKGVPDRGADPAVVAVDIDQKGLCTGTLIAPDVVLTARHCVAETAEQIACPATGAQVTRTRAASTLGILVGDDIASAKVVARGREIVAPPGDALCDADIALIVLDKEVDGVEPVDVRAHAAAKGEHVRAVGFGRSADGAAAGLKLARDHVKVLDTSDAEFLVGESTCQGDSGGPAFDESTGEIVGVVSRGGPQCDGAQAHNIYTRVDTFMSLIDEALAKSRSGGGGGTTHDAGKPPKHRKDGGKTTPPSDLGGACHKGSDCAAGVCVTAKHKQYCSRPCDSADHCPTNFKCARASSGHSVCVEK